jgi:branched-subunit amino acid transport protein
MLIEDWYVYAAILLLALCSVITRAGYFLFGHLVPLPDHVRSALRYAPLAALTAIIVPEVLPWTAQHGPVLDLKLVAAIVSIWVFQRTRSALLLIVSGMLALWLMRWIASF